MMLNVRVLLVATLCSPWPVDGMAAQTPQPPTAAAETPREEHPAPLLPVATAIACDPAIRGATIGPDTTMASGFPPPSVTDPGQASFCSRAVPLRPEDDGGEWYARRLALHRYSAWAAVGAFPVEIYTGWRLRTGGADPEWVRDTHRATAWVLGTTFTVNTVTGVWNWWDSRKEPEGRNWRTAHTLVMVAADAAMFATARAGQARARGTGGEWHRELAFTTAGLTALGHVMMLGPFRRD